MKDLTVAELFAALNAGADVSAARIAEATAWSDLIEAAMACNPAPLIEAMRTIHFKKGLYPQQVIEFLNLMVEHQPRLGRPKKDGNEAIRAAAKAWRKFCITKNLELVNDFYKRGKLFDKRNDITAEVNFLFGEQISLVTKPGRSSQTLRNAGFTATEMALETLADAGFGASAEAIRNEVYPRKKGTTKV